MLTGENGILTQAQRVKKETENAEKEEDTIINQYESYINQATNTEAVVGEIVTGGNRPYTNNGTAIIPEGFMIVPGLDDVEEGLVISDNASDTEKEGETLVAEGNQFVWVPVPDFDEFKRHDFGVQGYTDDMFVTDKITENKFYEPAADGIANTTEVEKMYKSVKDNKGFYIGRYEAGTEMERNENSTIEDEVLSKKNKFVYNYIGWNNDGTMTTETGGAVEKAKKFSEENGYINVTSTLVYGVEWDAVMRWISKDGKLAGYLMNSTGKGNHATGSIIQTGSNPEYQLKNIYDIAGNVWEWTMETESEDYRVDRGGGFTNKANEYPCSSRGLRRLFS